MYVQSDLNELQVAHAARRFHRSFVPPLHFGRTCSTVAYTRPFRIAFGVRIVNTAAPHR